LQNLIIDYRLKRKEEKQQKGQTDSLLDEPKNEPTNKVSNLEEKLISEDNQKLIDSIDYSFHEQQLLESVYQEQLDYNRLFTEKDSKKEMNSSFEDEYWLQTASSEKDSDILSNEEAEETLKNIQYAHLLGQGNEVSMNQRRKFYWWIKENPALFNLFENMHALTRDVDYQQY